MALEPLLPTPRFGELKQNGRISLSTRAAGNHLGFGFGEVFV